MLKPKIVLLIKKLKGLLGTQLSYSRKEAHTILKNLLSMNPYWVLKYKIILSPPPLGQVNIASLHSMNKIF